MIKSGLCSVTFRDLGIAEIVDLVVQAGLDGIEWGGDVHVPHGDLRVAKETQARCADAGIAVASYGSYHRLDDDTTASEVLETAVALGTSQVRVWAGRKGSDTADDGYVDTVATRARELAVAGLAQGIEISLECHGNTLTDTMASACKLIDLVNHENLKCYFQLRAEAGDAEGWDDFIALQNHISYLHVFYYSQGEQRALSAGKDLWSRIITTAGGERYALLEFVRGGEIRQFREDAAMLKSLIG